VTCAALLLATRRSGFTHGGLSLAALSLKCRIDKHKVARALGDICLAVSIANGAPRFHTGKTDVGALVRRFAEEFARQLGQLPRNVELPDGERRRLAETALRVLVVAEAARVAEGRSPTAFAAAVVAFAAQVVFRVWQLGGRNVKDINKLAAAVAGCGERTVRPARCATPRGARAAERALPLRALPLRALPLRALPLRALTAGGAAAAGADGGGRARLRTRRSR